MVAGAPQSSSARGKARASTRETMVQPSQAQEPPDSKDKGSSSKVRSCHKCAATLNRIPRKDGGLPAFSYCTTCVISYHTTDCGFRFLRGSLAPTPEALQACPKCSGVCLCCGGPVKCHAGSLRLKRRKPQLGSEGTKTVPSPQNSSWGDKPLVAEPDVGTEPAPEVAASSSPPPDIQESISSAAMPSGEALEGPPAGPAATASMPLLGAGPPPPQYPLPTFQQPPLPSEAPHSAPLAPGPEIVEVPRGALQHVLSAMLRVVVRQQAHIGELNLRLAAMGAMIQPQKKGQAMPIHTWSTIGEEEKARYLKSLKADLMERLRRVRGTDNADKGAAATSGASDLQGMLARVQAQARSSLDSAPLSSRSLRPEADQLPAMAVPASAPPPDLSFLTQGAQDFQSVLPVLLSLNQGGSGVADAAAQLQDGWASQAGQVGRQGGTAADQATMDMEFASFLLAEDGEALLGDDLLNDLMRGTEFALAPPAPAPDLSQGDEQGSRECAGPSLCNDENTSWPDPKRTKRVKICEHAVAPSAQQPRSLAQTASLLSGLNTTITKLGRQIVMLCSAIIVFEIAVGLAHDGFFSRALGLPWADSLVAVPADTPYCLWILALVVNLLLGSLGVRQGDTVFFRSMTYPGVHQVYAAGLFLKELFALYVLGSGTSQCSSATRQVLRWGRSGLLLAAFAALTHTIRAFRQYLCQVAILLDSLQRPARPLPAPRQLQTPPAAPEYCQVIAPPQAPKVTSTPFALDCDVKRIGEELFALPSREARRHHMRHLLLLLAKLQMHEYSLQVQEAYQLGKPPPDSRRQRALGKLPPMLK